MDYKEKTQLDFKENNFKGMDYVETDYKTKNIMDFKEIDFQEMDLKEMDFKDLFFQKNNPNGF